MSRFSVPGYAAPTHSKNGAELPPGVVLANGFQIGNATGHTVVGAPVATATGLQVQVEHKKQIARYPLINWSDVLRYELTGTEAAPSRPFAPSPTPPSSVLVLHLRTNQLVVNMVLAPSQVRRLLGPLLASIDQRQVTWVGAAPGTGWGDGADRCGNCGAVRMWPGAPCRFCAPPS
jgi:hypothetical protein